MSSIWKYRLTDEWVSANSFRETELLDRGGIQVGVGGDTSLKQGWHEDMSR